MTRNSLAIHFECIGVLIVEIEHHVCLVAVIAWGLEYWIPRAYGESGVVRP